MFLSIVLLVSLNKSNLLVEHPELYIDVPVIAGKRSTPTPPGIYKVSKAYSTVLKQNVLVFKKDNGVIWAIHENLPSRALNLESPTTSDNKISKGCIGIDQGSFKKLWNAKQELVLQVY